MTFDPRWLNQIPLASINGGDANALVSLTGSTRLDVADWSQSVALATIDTNGGQPLATAKLRSGNMFVAYEDGTANFKAVVINPAGTIVVSAVTIAPSSGAGNYLKAATLSNGNVVVCFYEPYANLRVRFAIYDERLNIVTPSSVVVGTQDYDRFSVTALADGNFVVGYANGTSKSAFQIFDQDGDVVRTEVVISTANYDSNNVVGLQNGNFMSFITNSTSAWYYIYDRQGVQVLGATSLGAIGTLIDYPTALLSNGQVVYAYNDSGDIYTGIIDQEGNQVVAGTAITTGANFTEEGALFSLPNNTYGLEYKASTGTAAYFQIRNYLNAVVKAQTAFGGTFSAIGTLTAGAFSNGNFLFLVQDTDIKRTIWQGSKAAFGDDLQVLGDLTLASGDAVSAISNSALASSSTTLPTSYAVKLYVDQQTGNVPRNVIHEGDSKVEVQDSTAESTQYITMQVNGTEYGRIEDTGTAIVTRFGEITGTRIALDTFLDEFSAHLNNVKMLSVGVNEQILGRTADTAVSIAQDVNAITMYSASNLVGTFNASGLTLATGVAVNKFSTDDTLGGYNNATPSTSIVPVEAAVRGYIDDIHFDMRDPNGFANRTDSTITFDDTSRTLALTTGSSYDYFIRGQRYRVTDASSVVISDVEGMHYIYYDGDEVLKDSTVFNINLIYNWAYVAAIYWDAVNNKAIYIGDERHGISMSGSTHYNLHNSRGTIYVDGLGVGDLVVDSTGALDVEAQCSISAGTIMDEDITTTIPTKAAPANIPMYYRSGADPGLWRQETADDFPLINTGSGRMAWNENNGGTWQLTEATEGYFTYTHLFAVNDNDNSRKIIGILGQSEYATLTEAREAANQVAAEVLQGLPFQEFTAIASLLFQTSSSYTNTPKASIRSATGGDYVDWRYAKITAVPGQVTDHGSLSGLTDDDHLQYARLTGLRPFTGLQSFNNGVTVAGGFLTLDNGSNINEFSIDGTLAGDSDQAVPTEQAVKTYVDTAIANLSPDKIWELDSKVEVVDDGTNAGYVTIVTDNVEVAHFDVLSSTQRIGKATESRLLVADDSVVIHAGATPAEVLNLTNTSQIIGLSTDEKIVVDQSGNSINAYIINSSILELTTDIQILGKRANAGVETNWDHAPAIKMNISSAVVGTFNSNGLTLTAGTASVNEFSIDGTLAGDSDQAVPTEQAVKTYVDTAIAGLAPDKIWADDSYVQVVDDGTNAGFIEIVADGVQVSYWDAAGATVRLGKASAAGRISISDTAVTANIGADERLNITSDTQTIGNGLTDSIQVETGNQRTKFYSYGLLVTELDITGNGWLMFGRNNKANLKILDNGGVNGGSVYITAQDVQVATFSSDEFVLGWAGDTRIYANGTTDNIDFYIGSGYGMQLTTNGLQLAQAGTLGGAIINEFSNDGTFAGDSTTALVTEHAAKDYVDTQIAGLSPNRIWQLNSEVLVTDTGTDGQVDITADGVVLGSFTDNRVYIGDNVNNNVHIKVDLDDSEIFLNGTTSQKGSVTQNRVWFGDNGTNAGIDIKSAEQTVEIYVGDAPDTTRIFLDGTTASSYIYVNELDTVFYGTPNTFGIGNPNASAGNAFVYGNDTGLHIIDVNSTLQIALFDSTGLQLATGAKINEFSTDDTLGDATPSDNIVSTQAAVKSYVDSQIGGQANRIWEGNSEMRVTDTGTGSIIGKADNVAVFSLGVSSQSIGNTSGSRLEVWTLGADLYANNVQIIDSSATGQVFGVASDSRLVLSQSADTADLYAGTAQIIDGNLTSQTFGVSGDSNLFLDQANNFADLYAGTVQIIDGATQTQVFGVAGDSRLALDQLNDTADLYAGTVKVLGATENVLNLGVSGDTYFSLNQNDDQINAYTGNTLQMQVENSGVSIEGDLTVRGNLSIDGTAFIVFNEEVKTEDNIITVNYGDPGPGVTRGIAGLEVDRGSEPIYQFIFQESSDTFRVGETGQTQAVATREDDPDGDKVAWWSDADRMFKTLGDEYIKIDQTANNIIFVTGLSQRGQFDSDGLTLQLGTSVNEFSTDGTLAGDSDDAVPTEKAVKTYVDAQIGGQSNIIFQDDSMVRVIDDGTAIGYIEIIADGVQVGYFDAQASTQRIGKATESRLLVADDTVTVYAGATPTDVLSLGETQRLGTSTGTRVTMNPTAHTLDMYVSTTQIFASTVTAQTFGVAGDTYLELIQNTDIARIYSGGTTRLSLAPDSQWFGDSGDTRIMLIQSSNTIDFTAANVSTATFTNSLQRIGVSGDTLITLIQASNTIDFTAGNIISASLTDVLQRIGRASDSRLEVDPVNDLVYVYAGTTQVINAATTTQTFGVTGDSRLFLDQTNDLADLYAGTTQIIDGAMTTQTFGVSGDSRLVLDQTADTAKLYAGTILALDAGVNVTTLGTAADTSIALNQSGDLITFTADGTSQATFGVAGLTLLTGASIVEFSIDGTLVDNADTVVPTEKAVKTYVDTQINDLRQELDLINVRNVYADTTASTGDVILADTTAGDITIQLMESLEGKIIIKKKSTDANKVYITTTPGMIDGQSQIIIDTGYQAYTFVCDGTNFFII